MDIIQNFKQTGYVKFKAESALDFKRLEDCVHKVLNDEKIDGDLETLHERVSLSELNPLRLKIFNRLNSLPDWESSFAQLGETVLQKIIGLDVSIQTKLNLSIQFPNDETSLQPLHTDRATGHSLYELVLWVSFTESASTASMYIMDVPTTQEALFYLPQYETGNYEEFEKKYESRRKFIDVKPADCLLFSSNLYHGNTVNRTTGTRVSINCRFKNCWAPEQNKMPNERITGSFYKPLRLSPCSTFGNKFLGMDPKFEK